MRHQGLIMATGGGGDGLPYFDGIVSAWEFGESGGTAIDNTAPDNDSTGTINAGTLGGGVWAPSSVNDYTSLSDAVIYATIGAPFSVEFYINFQGPLSNIVEFGNVKADDGSGEPFGLWAWNDGPVNRGTFTAAWRNGSRLYWGDPNILPGTYHCVYTYNGAGIGSDTNHKGYINGSLKTAVNSGILGGASNANRVGSNRGYTPNNGSDFKFFRIYNRVLSAAEVSQLYADRNLII